MATSETETEEFCQLLKTNNVCIAGGSVLKSVIENSDFKLNDIDIYAHKKSAIKIGDFLFKNGFEMCNNFDAQNYSSSLSRNKIITLFTFVKNQKFIDLMIIQSDTTPQEVIKNFDWSFFLEN